MNSHINQPDQCYNNKISSKCNYYDCNKKLKLTDIKCRCGFKFCAIHRYSDKHNCTFNYKDMAKNQLIKQNPVINFQKIQQL